MGDPSNRAKAKELEHLAGDLHALAFDMAEDRLDTASSDAVIAEGERIAAAVRSVVRGHG